MPSPVITARSGYTEDDYLTEPYLGGAFDYAYGFQATMVVNAETARGQQALMTVAAQEAFGQQALMSVSTEEPSGFQAAMALAGEKAPYGTQAQMVVDTLTTTGLQTLTVIDATAPIGQQVRAVVTVTPPAGMQAQMETDEDGILAGMSAKADTLRHALLGVYLVDEYLVGPYLVDQMGAYLGMQAEMVTLLTPETGLESEMFIAKQVHQGMQARMVINAAKLVGQQARMLIYEQVPVGQQAEMFVNATKRTGSQAEMVILKERSYGHQVQLLAREQLGMSAVQVIYNVTQLRLMWDFPSRGVPADEGLNWTATNQASGDFSPNNLNTDIEEQVFRSASTSVDLICDTGVPQGVTIDTIAIRNHNLTTSALVQVQGSKDDFASVDYVFDMVVDSRNAYYIAPSFPTSVLQQNVKWKFIIQDSTNPDGYIQIGLIVFGNSRILSLNGDFNVPLVRGYRHFKDVLPTEGFTNVMNNRALKQYLRLSFSDMERSTGDYDIIEDLQVEARTSLKVLVIPNPQYPARFAVFAKMTEMPQLAHNSIGEDADGVLREYVTFDLSFDESL